MKRSIISTLIFIGICVIVVLGLFKFYKKAVTHNGIDRAGIKWEYNDKSKILRFSNTKNSNGKMCDYIEDSEEYHPESIAPWWEYKEECKKVVFGKGISYIGAQTCWRFRNLKEIEMAEDITAIGYAAFEGCINLKKFQSPQKLKEIGTWAFAESGLRTVLLKDGLESIKIGAFSCTKVRKITIPDTTMIVSNGAFAGCGDLREVTLPENLSYIAGGLFSGCIRLKSINIPNGVVEIGEYALGSMEKENALTIRYLRIPQKVRTLGANILAGNMIIEKIRIESSKLVAVSKETFIEINPKVVVEVPKEKYDEYKEMLYTHGLPETAKVVAY